jgi:hypothetical protein
MADETESIRERIGDWIRTMQTKALMGGANLLIRFAKWVQSPLDYPEKRIARMAAALSDQDPTVRGDNAHRLGDAADLGVDIAAAMSALVKLLSDDTVNLGNTSVRGNVQATLMRAVASEKNRDAALSALANALYHENKTVRDKATQTLERAIERCASAGHLDEAALKLREAYGTLMGKCRYGKEQEPVGTGFRFYRLMVRIADRKNVLASQRDVLLDDMPKPPNRGEGTLYRAAGRLVL